MERPTSPHLTIYKPQISSVLSITHRFTGIALYVGAIVLVWWLIVAAYYPVHYVKWHHHATSWPGRILLLGWLFSFYYHLANGIRHLFWDMGKGYTIPVMTFTGWLVVLFSLGMTAGSVAFIYHQAGLL